MYQCSRGHRGGTRAIFTSCPTRTIISFFDVKSVFYFFLLTTIRPPPPGLVDEQNIAIINDRTIFDSIFYSTFQETYVNDTFLVRSSLSRQWFKKASSLCIVFFFFFSRYSIHPTSKTLRQTINTSIKQKKYIHKTGIFYTINTLYLLTLINTSIYIYNTNGLDVVYFNV